MKVRVLIPFVICIVMTIGSAGIVWGSNSFIDYNTILPTKTEKKLARLDDTAASLYEAAYMNNRQAAFIEVQQLQRLIEGDLKYSFGKIEGWQALAQAGNKIELMLTSGSKHVDWLTEAARIKLTTDALIRPEHALWLQYESVMLDDLSRVKLAWNRQTGDGAVAALAAMNSLKDHLLRIESAMEMIYGTMHGAELKERVRYTNQLLEANAAGTANKTLVNHSIQALNQAIIRLFDESGRTEALPAVAPISAANPLSWALFIGTLISAVLTYSGWSKYKRSPYGVKPLP